MTAPARRNLDFLFHPRSIALVGITTANPEHWTRTFLDSMLEFKFEGKLYLVNPKGGEIKGLKVYRSLAEVPGEIDYVIGLVPAPAAPRLVEESAAKGARAIHFCTSGFSETGEPEGIRLEAELIKAAKKFQMPIIGPNCMGIYCPGSRMSFAPIFPREPGRVGAISQSGGNANFLVRQAMVRGVRFSKLISYGNACDLNECDFIDYLADDPATAVIAMYIEGIRDGARFRRVLEKATRKKPVVLLKGGLTQGGARAVAGHTASLAGAKSTWDALCRQLGIIMVPSLDEMVDVLVTLLFLPLPRGRNAGLIGGGGGASVLITDEFEKHGLKVPPLPSELVNKLREFTPAAGNILRNPVDYSQTMDDPEKLAKAIDIVSGWDGIDFVVKFVRTGQSPSRGDLLSNPKQLGAASFQRGGTKPVAIVLEPSIVPEEQQRIYAALQECTAARSAVYYSFGGAANAIDLVLANRERFGRLE